MMFSNAVRTGNREKANLAHRNRRRSSVAGLASPIGNRRGSVQGDGRSAGSGSPIARLIAGRGNWNDGLASNEDSYQLSLDDDAALNPTDRWEKIVRKMFRNDWSGLSKRIKQCIPDDVTEIFNKSESDEIKFPLKERIKYFSEFNKMSGCFRASASFEALNSAEIEVLVLHKLKVAVSDVVLQELIKKNVKICGSSDGGVDFEAFVSLLCEIRKLKPPLDSAVGKRNFQKKMKFLINFIPIDPESSGKQAWDLFCMMLLLYCSFSIPFSVAFLDDTDVPDSLQNFEILVDALFMLDIVLSFVTWYDDKGYVIRDQRKIIVHYLETWFLPDFAGSFPFDRVLAVALESQPDVSSTNFVRVLKIFRMLKLIRAVKFMSKLNKLKQSEGFEQFGNMIGVASAMFLIFFVAHIVGCCFAMLLDIGEEDNWLLHYNPDLVQASIWVRYQTALYWAIITITTMGYGDVLPVNTTERIFVIFAAIIGAIVFSYCMGTISSLLSQYSNADEIFSGRLRTVAEYLQFRNISGDLKRRIRSYYSLTYRRSGTHYQEADILNDILNEPLRAEILREMGDRAAHALPILQGLDPRCVGIVYSRLRPASLGPGQAAYIHGSLGSDMYFIVSGCVRLYPGGVRPRPEADAPTTAGGGAPAHGGDSDVRRRTRTDASLAWRPRDLGPGETFGELAAFAKEHGGTCVRPETVEATQWTTVLTLSRENMESLEHECPQVPARFRELCGLRALEVRVRQRGPQSEEAPPRPPAAAERSGGGPYQLQLRVSRLRMELLRLREGELLAPAVAGDSGSEIMQLLLGRGRDDDQGTACPSQGPCPGGWMSVSCVLGDSGELLCIEHSLEGLARPAAVSLGYLVRDLSRYRVLEPADLDAFGRVGTRTMWGFEVLTFPAATPSPASAKGGMPKAAAVAGASAGSGRLVYLASTSRQEFDELSDALSGWLRRALVPFDAHEPEAKDLPVLPTSASNGDSAQVSAAVTECGSWGQHEASALAGEIAALRREVDGLSDENMALRRRLIYTELRVWDPQDGEASESPCLRCRAGGKRAGGEGAPCANGGCRQCRARGKTVPRTQLEEAHALARIVEAEADRLRGNMLMALGLLKGIKGV